MSTREDMPMWEDPQESSALRQLLRAGHVENSDYDVERGLARHLAQLQAGAPVPAWAVQSTLQKSAGWSVLAWILPPMITAGVVGAWLAIRPPEPTALAATVATSVAESSAPEATAIPAPVSAAAPAVVAPAPTQELAAADTTDQRRDHRVVASTRNLRQSPNQSANQAANQATTAARSGSSRRGRGSRSDDSNLQYAAANVGRSASADSPGAAVAGVTSAAVSSKASASDELAAKQDQAQEPAAEATKAKEAKAKPERRSKEEAVQKETDEVTGARLEREMRMLAVAQRVLTEDPARSLKLCRQGESEFRGSMFSAERKQVALLALVQLGRVDQARREGIPFLRAFPNAPWSARLREALSSGHVPNP